MPRRPYSFSLSNRILDPSSVFSPRSKKERVAARLSIPPVYLHEGNSLISLPFCFPGGYIVISGTEIRRWSFAASWNSRACFISGPAHSSFFHIRQLSRFTDAFADFWISFFSSFVSSICASFSSPAMRNLFLLAPFHFSIICFYFF